MVLQGSDFPNKYLSISELNESAEGKLSYMQTYWNIGYLTNN